MAKPKRRSQSKRPSRQGEARARQSEARMFCALPAMPPPQLGPDVTPARSRAILVNRSKWVNGTVLRYYFFDKQTDGEEVVQPNGTRVWRPWTTSDAEKDVVRKAFKLWKDLGVGLDFKEVDSRDEAELRIGFMRGDGSWSYVGRDVLNFGRDERTMNFGWPLSTMARELDTALHEIGHTLGFPHEHQNPNAGIVWDEEAVYRDLGGPPNNWPRETTHNNIIRKIPPESVRGSNWDANSVMHYPFRAGLIKEPAQYRTGLRPAGGLSEWDRTYVKTFYPPLGAADHAPLRPHQSVALNIGPGQQRNFTIEPDATRTYDIATFGTSDTVVVLFEEVNGELRQRAADDDSGEDRNAHLREKLFKGRKYALRIRLYYKDRSGETSVMLW